MKIIVKDDLYDDLLNLLKDIKLTQGNVALNSTLRRHPKVTKYLLENQKSYLHILEDSLQLETESK